jgi:acid phosphatase
LRGHRLAIAAVSTAAAVGAVGVAVAPAHDDHDRGASLRNVKHIVVIYEENHSFDNLYGGWEGVNGLSSVDISKTVQVNQAGQRYGCLLQDDVNLASPTPLSTTCTDSSTATPFASHFTNAPFTIDDYIKPGDTTCPPPGDFSHPNGYLNGTGLPGGCTRDLVHRFYQEQYQLDGGKQNRYVTGSDAVGLTMGTYDTRALPIYQYLHSAGHPRYAIADDFFQGAFGGSFLNHQWLVAARTPVWPDAVNTGNTADPVHPDLHSVVDSNGFPNSSYPLYKPTSPVVDGALTESCNPPAVPAGRIPAPPGTLCGDYAVNTIQPFYQPYQPGTIEGRRLPPQTAPTIGDRLSAAHVDWAWYSGGWSNADGRKDEPGWTNGNGPTCSDPNTATGATYPNCPDKLFQYHHQALNYYASFAPHTAAREQHLRDEKEFESLAAQSGRSCKLKSVSFIKPIGAENEHPGYTGETRGSDHLVDLLKSIEGSACARDTMVIVTYDEFGGQWDHVSPPGQGGAYGPHDAHGPGTRIPALVVSPMLPDYFVVDHTEHDTTSIAATIEHRYGLRPLSSRDAQVADLSSVFERRRGSRYW